MAKRGKSSKGPSLKKGPSLEKSPSLDKGSEINLDKDSPQSNEDEEERFTGPTLTYEGDDLTITASPFGSVEARVDLIENDGLEVELVVGIDVSPVDFGVDYDVQTGELGVGGGVGIPGDILGISGGLTIDTDTGEIVEITGGVEIGGLSVELEQSLDGCQTTMTITYFGVGLSSTVNRCGEDGDGDGDGNGNGEGGGNTYPENPPGPIDYKGMGLKWIWTHEWHRPQMTIEYKTIQESSKRFAKYFRVTSISLIEAEVDENKIYCRGAIATDNFTESLAAWKYYFHMRSFFDKESALAVLPEVLAYYSTWRKYKTRVMNTRLQRWDEKNVTNPVDRVRDTFEGYAERHFSDNNTQFPWGNLRPGGHFGELLSSWLYEDMDIRATNCQATLVPVDPGNYTPPPPPPPPPPPLIPPPPPRRENNMNDCCRATLSLLRQMSNVTGVREETAYPIQVLAKDENDQPVTLLPANLIEWLSLQGNGAILQLLTKISNVTGTAEENQYPGTMPKSMLGYGEETKDINNINDWFLYLHDTNDERWGQWRVKIEVKNKEGESKEVNLPNLAEAIAEIYGLLLQLIVNSQSNQSFNVKNLVETGLVRQQVAKSSRDLKVILDVLNFDYEEDTEDLNLTFSVQTEEKKIETEEDLLEESTVKIPTRKFSDTTSLKEILGELKQAAAIIRAVHWRKLDPKKDMGKQVMDYLNLGLQIADRLPGLKEKFAAEQSGGGGGEDAPDRWDAWLEKIEEEWATELGRDDGNRSDRPRIREVGRDLKD